MPTDCTRNKNLHISNRNNNNKNNHSSELTDNPDNEATNEFTYTNERSLVTYWKCNPDYLNAVQRYVCVLVYRLLWLGPSVAASRQRLREGAL
jgi:hypothetical protein